MQHHNFLERDHLYETDEWLKSNSNLKISDQIQQGMSWPRLVSKKCGKERMYVGSHK